MRELRCGLLGKDLLFPCIELLLGDDTRVQEFVMTLLHAATSRRIWQRRLCSRQYTAPGCATGAAQ